MSKAVLYEVTHPGEEVGFEDSMFFLGHPDGRTTPIDYAFNAPGNDIDSYRAGALAALKAAYGEERVELQRFDGEFREELDEDEGEQDEGDLLSLDEAYALLCEQLQADGLEAITRLPRIGA